MASYIFIVFTKNDAQVNEEGDAAQQAENQVDAETEMVEGTEQS